MSAVSYNQHSIRRLSTFRYVKLYTKWLKIIEWNCYNKALQFNWHMPLVLLKAYKRAQLLLGPVFDLKEPNVSHNTVKKTVIW